MYISFFIKEHSDIKKIYNKLCELIPKPIVRLKEENSIIVGDVVCMNSTKLPDLKEFLNELDIDYLISDDENVISNFIENIPCEYEEEVPF